MSIEQLVNCEYATIDAWEGAATARRSGWIDNGIVVLEENEPIGLLTASDLAERQHRIIIDCVSSKPVVSSQDKISDVLDLMKSSGNTALMVYDSGQFVGTISQNDILKRLNSNLSNHNLSMISAAHDLKSPIASIKMISDMLQENLKLSENRQLIDYLNQSCDFAQKIIDDILVTEEVTEETLYCSTENFDDLVQECTDSFAKEFGKKQISLVRDLQFGENAWIDRPKFKRVLHNLLSNSIKFTRKGGKIEVTTDKNDGILNLIIKDTGIGIPHKMQDHIFDKFTKAKRMGTDGETTTGLGMYLTKKIVELHRGKIRMESDGHSGTTFFITLNLLQKHNYQ